MHTTSDQATYWVNDGCFCMNSDKGATRLCNFTANIDREIIYHDGNAKSVRLRITGHLAEKDEETGEPIPLPPVEIDADELAGMSWVGKQWGMAPVIYPHSSAERHIKTAMQIFSKPKREHVYQHTGWSKAPDGHAVYLSGSGGIGKKGLDSSIKVQLPHELSRYSLPAPAASKDAFTDSMRLVNLGPAPQMWSLLLACYRSAIGDSDFSIHLAGRTGTYKSETCSLFQSHFGEGMDARHLPASWSSTANANERLAYQAKDAIMVMDDFVPHGTAYQVRQLQANADRLIRGQGNQAGRSRLNDTSGMQATMYPRGLILSTGEDVPDGHSVRARMLILELTPGDIEVKKLTECQERRESLPQAMADWVHWLAGNPEAKKDFKQISRSIRDKHLGTGHTRTPPIIGDLCATAVILTQYATHRKYYSEELIGGIFAKAQDAVVAMGRKQREYLESADPVTALKETIRLLLTSHMAHVRTRTGGIPEDADRFGFTRERKPGEMDNFKSNGARLGWIDPEDDLFMLDPSAVVLLKKHSGGKLAITPATLQKRMKEAGLLTRVDDARQRNTVRMHCEGHQRQVLCMSLQDVMEIDSDA